MSIVEQYWTGVLQRLQAEVDIFNRLIPHSGEMGRENELSLSRLIESLIPQKFGIGSGIVIDSLGEESSQTDIVIYDRADEPAILAQTNQVLFPVENVRACIEVKTTIDGREIEDVGKKVESVRCLQPKGDKKPVYTLLAYGSRIHADAIAEKLVGGLPIRQRPDLVCVLTPGLMAGKKSRLFLEECADDQYIVGVARLHIRGSDGERRSQEYVVPPLDWVEAKYHHSGVTYPITLIHGQESVIVEPSRALLQFCECLMRAIAYQEKRPLPSLSHYVTPVARELTVLKQVDQVEAT